MKKGRAALLFLVVLVAGFACSSTVWADGCTDWTARLDSYQGKIEAKRSGSSDWTAARDSDIFCAGDMLRVAPRSRAVVVLRNETVMRLDQNTTLTFSSPAPESHSLLDLLKGAAYFISRTPRKFRVNTPFLNAGVEGTEFLVQMQESEAGVSVYEGVVLASNSNGSVRVTAGQTAVSAGGAAPILRSTVHPLDAVQWTLYYPELSTAAEGSWQARAASLLAAGRVDEARGELDRVLSREPNNADALSYLAVIAVARNEKTGALDYGRRAVAVAPGSANALLALSYAQQASFDLDEARRSAAEAAARVPGSGMAWARLAELHHSFGDHAAALSAAEKAAAAAPGLSRTRTVLGFAYLSRLSTDDALAAFSKAAELDPADPLPRLGAGLAKIRKGDLTEGRREIEIAVSLDPADALVRSYLGKAYYEEARDRVADEQFALAKDADPKDPTAFFYSAIQKQAQNRPVEALQDLEHSMELNSNRSVYRSSLLLDEDLAARGAGLARIYADLGFGQLALEEGYRAVAADPASASAHRFLSDSYAALPRHEIARVSELLQAQLLQPVNISPLQPHLAEARLYILSGAGPSDISFSEYNPLFERNRYSLLLSGIVGSHDTIGDEFVVSAVHDRLSISAGQFHYRTDGFRVNNDLQTDIYNLFGQYSFSRDTSIQAELRSTDKAFGDLTQNFFPDFSDSIRERDRFWSFRFGGRHRFSLSSDLIGSVIYQRGDLNTDIGAMPSIGLSSFGNYWDERAVSAELQHIFHLPKFRLITGAGYSHIDHGELTNIALIFPPITFVDVRGDTEDHTNAYAYGSLTYPDNLTVTAGGSVNVLHGLNVSEEQFNPKFGISWTPLPGTTVRAAAFRTLERTMITNQTLEPTNVAGFNQFFDDVDGTDAWNYGIGVDQKFCRTIFGGVEFARRDLKVPYLYVDVVTGDLSAERADWNEQTVRAYAYWTPSSMISVRAEYQYEKFVRDSDFSAGVERVRTHRFPLGISFFDPHGFSADVRATYIDQRGTFVPQESFLGVGVDGADRFWLFDAGVSYRLPKHRGMISFEARNLFDTSFSYQDMDPVSPSIQPRRSIFLKVTLAL